MQNLLDFYNENSDGNHLNKSNANILKNINLLDYECKTYLSFSRFDPYFTYVESKKELLIMAQKILKHNRTSNDFWYLELWGERKQGDYTIKIKKDIGERAFFDLYYKNEKIGYRIVEFNPLQCYLNLDVMTISGGSEIEKDFIGKGLGRFLYDTIDSIIPYQQIPHGYAGAVGGLTDYSNNFWKNRRENQAVPVISDAATKKLKELDYINKIRISIRPLSFFLSNPNLKTSDYLWNEEENIVIKKDFFPDYMNNKNKKFEDLDLRQFRDLDVRCFKDFSLKDIKNCHFISLKKNIKGYITVDIFKDIVKNDFNYEDCYDDNVIMEAYKELYPYNPYPDDINIMNLYFYGKDEKIFYKKNGDQYDVGIICPLNYPEKNNTNYCYQILKTVDKQEFETILKNIEKAKTFFNSNDYENIRNYESSNIIKNEDFYEYQDIGSNLRSRNTVYRASLENILNGQYIYIKNDIFDTKKKCTIEEKILSGEELKKHIPPEFENIFATEKTESKILFQYLSKDNKNDIEMNIVSILKSNNFYIDEKNIYFGNNNFKEKMSKPEFIQELKKLDLENIEHLNDILVNCYGNYKSKISYNEKKAILEELEDADLKDDLKININF